MVHTYDMMYGTSLDPNSGRTVLTGTQSTQVYTSCPSRITIKLAICPKIVDGQTARATHRARKESVEFADFSRCHVKKFNGRSVPKLDPRHSS